MFIGGRCITWGRFWGGKGLKSEKGVLEEKELLGVNIIGVFLPEELLDIIRLSVFLSLLKEIITVPSIFWAIKSGSVFSIFGGGAMVVATVQEGLCLSIVSVEVHKVYCLGLRLEEGECVLWEMILPWIEGQEWFSLIYNRSYK